ncbi:MAG TPA: GNAT family N-acetyltransferase [Streptosporangiaceae bacterium]|jgi:predicted GNAT superfamily acetyltransferase|nr:GNAT family N-acetyltransferase [Streptosporangiaceae bacterium]
MTAPPAPPHSPPAQALDSSLQAAQNAARAAGVQIRELIEVEDLQRLCALVDEIWHPDPGNPPVTAELLRALAHAGNYVAGAFTDDGQLVGCCAGFFASPATHTMHSHIAGVSLRLLGHHVGFALKLHQRAWALARDVTTITWTFDPLVCRNAYFNLAKLAASPVEYLPDFYGAMDDVINAGDDSDRLLVHWRLTADSVARACAGAGSGADAAALRAAGAAVALDADADGQPVTSGAGPGSPTVLARVPRDIETLRRQDAATARRWRRAVRHVLGGPMAEGGRVTGFDRGGWYVVQRGDAAGHDRAGLGGATPPAPPVSPERKARP